MGRAARHEEEDGTPVVPGVTKSLALGAVAGITGCTTVYPLDLVKTILQNQRHGAADQRGFFAVLRHRFATLGFRGLYTGLSANLVGITPEKALKLAANSHARRAYGCSDTQFRGVREILAGGTAGFVQFVATNPMEIVKIRLQVAQTGVGAPTMFSVVQELGLLGLYRGSAATLLRDVPFSMLYFPIYSYLKLAFRDAEAGRTSFGYCFLAGTGAGVFSAFLSTPADVIKTRLQVAPTEGAKPYAGVVDCTRAIVREEGAAALFKGSGPRMGIIAPLFGIALMVYEILGDKFT